MSAATETSRIELREITGVTQMRAVESLQREVWGVPDLDVVPLTHLVATREAGGALIGAFDEEELVGFVYGFPSLEHGQMAHHSHMLAVKSTYRNHDLGRKLKLAQREHVIAQGIKLITWTFDPLQSLNAYFNFTKLGVVSDRYLLDFYGEDAASFLHRTGTDRLWVSWLLSADRVKKRISDVGPVMNSEVGAPLVKVNRDESPQRTDLAKGLSLARASIEIPSDINALQERSPETAAKWREDTRWAFTQAIQAGYLVEEFFRETQGDRRHGKYVLVRRDLFDFAG